MKKASPYKIQVLDRALAVMDILAKDGPDQTLVELSEKLKLHKSTTHRLLMVLEQQKIVEKNTASGRYRLGLKLFELGKKAITHFDPRNRARRYLEQLVYETGETVHLCVLDDTEVVYLDKVEPERTVRMACTVGKRNPAYCTSVGKAILAYLTEIEVDSILRRHVMKPLTANTITTVFEMKAELEKIRQLGYSMDNEEIEEGVRCVGCVVRGPEGEPIAAISISGLSFRVTLEKTPMLAKHVMAAAASISEQFGFKIEKINQNLNQETTDSIYAVKV